MKDVAIATRGHAGRHAALVIRGTSEPASWHSPCRILILEILAESHHRTN